MQGSSASSDFHLQMNRNDFFHLPLARRSAGSQRPGQMSLPQFPAALSGAPRTCHAARAPSACQEERARPREQLTLRLASGRLSRQPPPWAVGPGRGAPEGEAAPLSCGLSWRWSPSAFRSGLGKAQTTVAPWGPCCPPPPGSVRTAARVLGGRGVLPTPRGARCAALASLRGGPSAPALPGAPAREPGVPSVLEKRRPGPGPRGPPSDRT